MTDVLPPDDFMAEMWDYANEVPMEQHPWFDGILHHRWTPEQIILGEIQHYHRVRTNPIHWGYILVNAVAEKRYEHMDAVLDNFAEEFARPRTHVDVMLQLLEGGWHFPRAGRRHRLRSGDHGGHRNDQRLLPASLLPGGVGHAEPGGVPARPGGGQGVPGKTGHYGFSPAGRGNLRGPRGNRTWNTEPGR